MKKRGFEVEVASIERSPKGVDEEMPTLPVILSKVKLAEEPNVPPSLNWIWVSAPVGFVDPEISLEQMKFPCPSVVIFPEFVKPVEQFRLSNLKPPPEILRPPEIVEEAVVEVILRIFA